MEVKITVSKDPRSDCSIPLDDFLQLSDLSALQADMKLALAWDSIPICVLLAC